MLNFRETITLIISFFSFLARRSIEWLTKGLAIFIAFIFFYAAYRYVLDAFIHPAPAIVENKPRVPPPNRSN